MQNKLWLVNIILSISILSLPFFISGCRANNGQQQDAQLQAVKEKQAQEKESKKLKNIEAQIENLFETLGGPSVIADKSAANGDSGDNQENSQQQADKEEGSSKQGQQKGEEEDSSNQGQQKGEEEDSSKQGQQKGEEEDSSNQGQQKGEEEDSSKQGQQKGEEEDSSKQGQQKDSTQQQGNKEENSSQKGDTEQQNGKATAQIAPNRWSNVDKIINKMHYQWNDLMPEIAKKGADMKLVDNFDNALNNLTTTAKSKDQDKVRTSANKLYSYVPDLYSLYRIKMSPEVKRMIYYTRNIILESNKDGWEQVEKDNEALEKSWSLFRNTLEKEQKKTGDKLDFSVYELKKVITEKEQELTSIKGRIVLNNIQQLQKSFEE